VDSATHRLYFKKLKLELGISFRTDCSLLNCWTISPIPAGCQLHWPSPIFFRCGWSITERLLWI